MREACGVCGAELPLSDTIRTSEMMNGTREAFDYGRCPSCGCVQLLEVPVNLVDYYNTYYGRAAVDTSSFYFRMNRLRFWSVTKYRDTVGGRVVRYLLPYASEEFLREIDKSSSIVDVGSASGELLLLMNSVGFEDLYGCDPYIDESIEYPEGVKVAKLAPSQLDRQFDVVMAHHVVEHVPNQAEFVQELFAILKVGGTAVIRIPTVSSWAYETYGGHWFQMDAPRHLFLHSRESIHRLLTSAGFTDLRVYDDSHILQILSSELYRDDVPFKFHKKWFIRQLPMMLISGRFRRLKNQVEGLNREGRGDQICILASKRAPDSARDV